MFLLYFVGHQPARVPMIQFRHGVRNAAPVSSANNAVENNPFVSAEKVEHHPDAIDFLELPAHFGRLPPLTQDEELCLLLGGAKD